MAFRVIDRWDTAKFYIEAFGYTYQDEFQPYDDDSVNCIALQPPERSQSDMPFITDGVFLHGHGGYAPVYLSGYHLAPEIFISDGKPGSVVGDWVRKDRGGRGGLHHLAYNVDSVSAEMQRWRENGWGKFLTDEPLECPGISQVFTEELVETGGVIYEFINRGPVGFCKDNVRGLMESTKDPDGESP